MYKIITILFHPFSFLLLGIFVLFNTNTYINFSYSDQLKIMVYMVLFINTLVLPVVFAWYLSAKGHITSLMMDDINDRKLIYFFTFLLYLATLFILSGFGVPSLVYKYTFGATLTVGSLFVFALIRKKLSAHLAGIGGLTGALIMLTARLQTDFLTLICILFVLSGIVGMARIELKAHNENEVYWGFLIGFISQIFIFA